MNNQAYNSVAHYTKSMSLRYQISIRILFFSLCILILGGSVAIWQARNAVREEVDSSIHLVLQLIKLGLSTENPPSGGDNTGWVSRLSGLEQTRHLSIQLREPSGRLLNFAGKREPVRQEEQPPAWFVNLVDGHYPKVEYQVKTFDNKPLTLIIQANPLDEITEVWQETLVFMVTIFTLTLLTILVVHWVFNKTLKSISTIVEALQHIETGEYTTKLPEFSTLEYDGIAKAINHMTDVLEDTRQQNRALTQHSLQIQEEERHRLAQELHDELGQSLTAIKMMAVTTAHEQADTKKIAQSISNICDHLMKVVRSMMQQLHPLILTELGLKATLEDLVAHWKKMNPGLSVILQCSDRIDQLDNKITIQVYRVIQECLTNIIRHAEATQVIIDLKLLDEQGMTLYLSVEDNGRGCEPGTILSGFGLLSMAERIKSLEGRFELKSQPGAGVRINAIIPII